MKNKWSRIYDETQNTSKIYKYFYRYKIAQDYNRKQLQQQQQQQQKTHTQNLDIVILFDVVVFKILEN